MKKISFIAGALILVLAVAAFVYVKGTPQYSLYQLRKAIENHDPDAAFQYFDVDSIVDNLMSDLMKNQEVKQASNGWQSMGQNMARGFMAMMLPQMKESLKGRFRTAITTPSDDFGAIKDIDKGKISDFAIKTEGTMAVVTRKDNDKCKFKMVKTPQGRWKIVELIMPEDFSLMK